MHLLNVSLLVKVSEPTNIKLLFQTQTSSSLQVTIVMINKNIIRCGHNFCPQLKPSI